jgi:hypothetical protein
VFAVKPKGFAGLDLIANVDLRGRVIAYEDGGQAWADSGGAEKANLFGDFILYLCGYGVAVQKSS